MNGLDTVILHRRENMARTSRTYSDILISSPSPSVLNTARSGECKKRDASGDRLPGTANDTEREQKRRGVFNKSTLSFKMYEFDEPRKDEKIDAVERDKSPTRPTPVGNNLPFNKLTKDNAARISPPPLESLLAFDSSKKIDIEETLASPEPPKTFLPFKNSIKDETKKKTEKEERSAISVLPENSLVLNNLTTDDTKKKSTAKLSNFKNNYEPKSIGMLPEKVLSNIFKLLPGSSRFVGSTNKQFHDIYKKNNGGKYETYKYGIKSISCLKIYLRERKDYRELRMSDKTIASYVGARAGRLDLVKWASTNEDDELLDRAIKIDAHICANAARGGNLHILKWLREQGCPWDWQTCAQAARGGHLEVLTWARSNGCPWNANVCANAAMGGNLRLLMLLRDQGCPWDWRTCTSAIRGEYLEILDWTTQQPGCPWNCENLKGAAEDWHVEMLQWARERGCPWNRSSDDGRATKEHLAVLVWAIDNGCPYKTKDLLEIKDPGFRRWFANYMIRYLNN